MKRSTSTDEVYKYSEEGGVIDGQICTGAAVGMGPCFGDMDGPLIIIDGRLAGLFYWARGCVRPDLPEVYIDIAYYRDWIDENAGL